MTTTQQSIFYRGIGYDAYSNIVELDGDYDVIDTYEPDPSVGHFGSAQIIVDHPDYPGGVAITAEDYADFHEPDPEDRDF